MATASSAAAPLNLAVQVPGTVPESTNLALALQEVFTVVVRVRANRQRVDSAESFRASVLALLEAADREAARAGYGTADIRAAKFAAVAFLDETILNSRHPAFADWARKPLQEELFAAHMAGELFFKGLDHLLQLPNSPSTADVLEVYLLCLLLGYRGKYSLGSAEELRLIARRAADRIAEVRGRGAPEPPVPAPPPKPDGWRIGLAWAAAILALAALTLFLTLHVSLHSAVAELARTAAQLLR